MKLTLSQRLARPVINFLVERLFPSGCFYGNSYAEKFRDMDESGGVAGQTAAMYLQHIMRKAGATQITFEFDTVIFEGKEMGSFRLTLEEIDGDEA
jgi:hypothetical protein